MSLKVQNLSLRFGNEWILRDIDLDASSGQIFGICGAIGSGKTSLLRAIAGRLKLSSGEISVYSNEIGLLANERPSIFNSLLGNSSNNRSSGEIQEANFERFLRSDSKVLLLDDPITQLDPASRNSAIKRLIAWLGKDKTAIYASSSFEQLASFADQILIIADGYSKQCGAPKDIYDHPESVSTAGLTGEINFIKARRISSSDADLPEFQTLEGGHRIHSQPTPKNRLGPLNKDSILAIRPEQIAMSMGASFPEDNLLRAVVTSIEFRGATSLIEFDAGGLLLRSRVFKVVGLQIGEECMLGLPPERIVVLRD